ncbi:hypothetical protein Vadar_026062 [Vaccinium darrowii]|uniref:Uncharacterized protein n=1 Tax=Vaccinium darrowii TaxID=229202 RepID=A0ACB7YFY3_9ERIC|nr:hypothetical protein Vadar_026062 [Vaccinium darrowii]
MAEQALKQIGATDGMFGKDELFIWVIHAFQQQKGLELSLEDTHDVLQDLRGHIDAVVLALLLFAWLAMLDTLYVLPRDQKLGLHFYMMILVLALVVGYFYRMMWDYYRNGIRFFFRHPLRVGDTCTIDGNKMQVKRLRIYDTVFLTMDGDDLFSSCALLLVAEIVKDPPLLVRRA